VDNSSEQKLTTKIIVARQPIYNKQMGVYGYELLFRSPDGNNAGMQPAKATAQVLAATLLDFDVDSFSQHRKLIINVTRAFIDIFEEIPLKPSQVILDIPDNCMVDDKLVAKLKELRGLGYGLSIGGMRFLKDKRLLPLADLFRVDVQQFDVNKLDILLKFFKSYPNISLLAIKVQTMEEYRAYCDKGFEFLQGYFLGRPRTYQARELTTSELSLLQLLSTIHNVETPIEELETIITHDASLSYKLIKLVNSPYFKVSKDIDSIKQAIVLLGRDEISKWASLLMLSGKKDKPPALMEIALLRSKVCELLSQKAKLRSDNYFTVGMFSALDLLLEQPIENILSHLPLSEEFNKAITDHEGLPGEALACALAFENDDYANIKFQNLHVNDLFEVYQQAIMWTSKVMKRL